MKNGMLNFKYALINVFYFLLVCGTAGYANNYLLAKGFQTSLIGVILTVISILTLFGQTWMAPIVDRSKSLNEKKFILFTLALAVVMFSLLLVLPAGSPFILVCVVIGFSFCAMGIPFLNSIAFIYESEGKKINYGLGRGVGSAAYAVAGLCIGWLIHLKDASILPIWLIGTDVLTIVSVASLKAPETEKQGEEKMKKKVSYIAFFKKYKQMLWVIIALILIFFTHMLINSYMINIIDNIGGDAASQGNATFIQAMVELPPMFAFAYLLKKHSVDTYMVIGGIFYSIKHILILAAPNMTVFYAAMVLQMLSYALIVPSSVYFANEHVEEQDRNQGQAVMAAATTIGGLFASFFGGVLLQNLGAYRTLWIGGAASIIGTLLLCFSILRMKKSA